MVEPPRPERGPADAVDEYAFFVDLATVLRRHGLVLAGQTRRKVPAARFLRRLPGRLELTVRLEREFPEA